MKRLITFILLAGLPVYAQYSGGSVVAEKAARIAADANLQGQITTNGVLIATNSANLLITSNAFVSADTVVSNAFVSADALKADLNGTNTAFTVANWIAVSNTTTYAAALVWDATNKVFIVTETEE